MIALTRLGSRERFFLNPDLIERIDTHVDTVVRLTSGVEYVVADTGDEIVEKIVAYRARVNATGPTSARGVPSEDDDQPHHGATVVELNPTREVPR